LLVKDAATISAMVLAIRESEGCPTSHTDVAVGPFGRCTAVKHSARDFDLGRESEALSLQCLVHLVDV